MCCIMVEYMYEKGLFGQPKSFSYLAFSYICTIVNHMAMQPRIYQPIERLNFLYLHPEKFESVMIPGMICSMKLIVEV